MPNSCDEHDLFFLEARDGLLESLSIRAPFIDFPGTGKPQESTASVWIDSKFEGYRLFLTEWADFTLAITIINMPKKKERPSQEAGRESGVRRTNHILDWSSASENRRNRAEKCASVCFKCRDDKRRRRGTSWWMEVFVPVDLFTATSYGPLKQPERLWERSQEAGPTPTNPNGNLGLCFLSQRWSNTQEDLPSVKPLTLSFSPSGLGSGSGRAELDFTQKVDSVPRCSRFRLDQTGSAGRG